jgi:transposase-like protein
MARRLGHEAKRELLAELSASGLSLARFARERGLHPETLYRWRRAQRRNEVRERFVEVQYPSECPPSRWVGREVFG